MSFPDVLTELSLRDRAMKVEARAEVLCELASLIRELGEHGEVWSRLKHWVDEEIVGVEVECSLLAIEGEGV